MRVIVRDAQEWRPLRARGKTAFVLRYGVLTRGVPMALVVAVGIELYLGGRFPQALAEPAFLGRLLLSLVVFSVSGCFRALMLWRLYEGRFGGGAAT